MRLAPLPLVVSLAFAAACGRTNLGDLPFDLDADANPRDGSDRTGTGGTSLGGAIGRGGGSGNVAGTGGGAGVTAGNGGVAQGGMAGVGGVVPVCGDGIVTAGEVCDPGPKPAAPALELRQGAWRMPVLPIVGPAFVITHYAYASRSSHTGFEAPGKSSLYLYRASAEAALNLVLLNGIDEDSTGLIQPESYIVFEIGGLPDTSVVGLSDDDVEFARTTPSTAHAEWDCNRNSDGGIIGALAFPGIWHLTITASFFSGITDWAFLSGAPGADLGVAAELPLDPSQPIELVASARDAGCRADCTAPRCGDGILDAGEICDDRNEQPGDGCFRCRPEP